LSGGLSRRSSSRFGWLPRISPCGVRALRFELEVHSDEGPNFLKAGVAASSDLLPYTLHGLGGADRVPVIQEIRHLHLEVRGFKGIVEALLSLY